MPTTPAIYCADIGANNEKAKKFGWWSNCEPGELECLKSEDEFEEANHGLLLWEAFVSWKKPAGQKGQKSRKPKDPLEHIRDASRAVEQFKSPCRCEPPRSITIEPVYSLVGAALLRSGWSEDLDLLKKACVIVRTCKDPESCAKEAAGE